MEIVAFNKERKSQEISKNVSQINSDQRITPKSTQRSNTPQEGEFASGNLKEVSDKFQGKYRSKVG